MSNEIKEILHELEVEMPIKDKYKLFEQKEHNISWWNVQKIVKKTKIKIKANFPKNLNI